MTFAATVDLYRACGRPALENGRFVCTTEYARARPYLVEIAEAPWGRLDDLEIDGSDYHEETELPVHGNEVFFSIKLPTHSGATFHQNVAALAASDPGTSRGVLPERYYLVDEDYVTSDAQQPDVVRGLTRACRLIASLAKLAHYHDTKPSSGYLRLVFLLPGRGSGITPVELDTKVSKQVIEAAIDCDPRLAEEISESDAANDPHLSAKEGVFGTTLATFVGNRHEGEAFLYLVTHWTQFVAEYHRDLGTYLSGFAFHKAKKEVAEAELQIASEFSKVMNDLTGKLLSIPISFAGAYGLLKTEVVWERILLLLGTLVASLIIYKTIANQKRQFERIVSAKNLVVGAMQGRAELYPQELSGAIRKLTCDLKRDETALRSTLRTFMALSWTPLLFAVLIVAYTYKDQSLAAAGFVWDWVGMVMRPTK